MKKIVFTLGLFLILVCCASMESVNDAPKLPDDYSDVISIKYVTSDDDSLNEMMYRVDVGEYNEMRGYSYDRSFVKIRFVRSIYDSYGIPQRVGYALHIEDFTRINYPFIWLNVFIDEKRFHLPIGRPDIVNGSATSIHENIYIIPLSSDILDALKVSNEVGFLVDVNRASYMKIAPRQLAAIKSML